MTRPESRSASLSQIDLQRASFCASQLIAEWTSDRPFAAREILSANPSLEQFRSIVIDLAYEEFCQRSEGGEKLDPQEFARGFPNARLSLLRLIEVHGLLQGAVTPRTQTGSVSWPTPGDDWLGFQLLEVLGHGAFSRVYLAREAALGNRLVVVKATRQAQGLSEAKLLGQLEHPNVVAVHSVQSDLDRGLTAVCLPFLGRTTLFDVLINAFESGQRPRRARAVLDAVHARSLSDDPSPAPFTKFRWAGRQRYVEGILELFEQLVSGLAYTHQKQILHLDIKPSNVLVTAGGRALLFDFNLSVGNGEDALRGGTLPYMAPEQLQAIVVNRAGQRATVSEPPPDVDDRTVDERTDLFSLAVSFYELLTGRLPFGSMPSEGSLEAMAGQLLERQRCGPAPLRSLNSDVDAKLANVIERCLAFVPADRVQSAQAVLGLIRRNRRWTRRLVRWSLAERAQFRASVAATVVLTIGVAVYGLTREPYFAQELRLGEAAFASQDYATAAKHLSHVLEIAPATVEARFLRASARAHCDDSPGALADARWLVDHDPEDGRAQAVLAYVGVTALNDPRIGVAHNQKAIECGFRTAAVYNNLGYCLSMTSDKLPEAKAALSTALEKNRDSKEARHNAALVGLKLLNTSRPNPAEVNAALSLWPEAADTQCLAALIWARAAADPNNSTKTQAACRSRCVDACSEAVKWGLEPDKLRQFVLLLPELAHDERFRAMKEIQPCSPSLLPSVTIDPLNSSATAVLASQ